MWQEFGRATPPSEGTVARPYTMQDLRQALADVSADRAFADEFFDRFIQGRDVVDYASLLARAGLILRRRAPGRPWIGPIAFDFISGAAHIATPTVEDTPAYAAGLDLGDELVSFDGVAITGPNRLEEAVQRRRAGDTVRMAIRRRGIAQDLTLTIGEDPSVQLIPVERTGRGVTAAEKAFRNAWLGSKQ
jgi:predicted metalloprotease with PDZ domain